MFGTTDVNKVNTEEYRVVMLKNILNQEKEVAKRSGLEEPAAAFNIDIFGENHNFK